VVDTGAVSAAWEVSLAAAEWNGVSCWRHCDLLPPNLLVEGGRLKAVIDFGSAGIGDPALDVIAAWSVFAEEGRLAFREGLGVDEGTWTRARGFALHQAVFIMQYYPKSNPGFVTMAHRTVDQVLGDMGM
jgi:aminoglycoside phosphotransferase (APT) family kinase protein